MPYVDRCGNMVRFVRRPGSGQDVLDPVLATDPVEHGVRERDEQIGGTEDQQLVGWVPRPRSPDSKAAAFPPAFPPLTESPTHSTPNSPSASPSPINSLMPDEARQTARTCWSGPFETSSEITLSNDEVDCQSLRTPHAARSVASAGNAGLRSLAPAASKSYSPFRL